MTGLSIGRFVAPILESILPGKVYPLVADYDTPLPILVYRRISITPQEDKDLIHTDIVGVEVVVLAAGYDDSVRLSERVRKAMIPSKTGGIEVDDIFLVSAEEARDDSTYTQILTFEIHTLL